MTPIPMTVRDVAHLTGLPVRTIQRWVLCGWLKDYGDGLTYMVDAREATDLAEQRPGKCGRRGRLRNPTAMA